jgi:hypothetical protein
MDATPAAPARSCVMAKLVWGLLVALLVVHVPAFLCMGLDHDVTVFDLFARNLLHGGVHYRDYGDINLPGMLWLHVAIRATLGWRPEAIRLVDLGIVGGSILLLLSWLPADRNGLLKPVTALLLFAAYFSTNEWCHCQRDPWMLLPALLALALRRRLVARLREPNPVKTTVLAGAFAEGLCWAAAFWIKPFVAVPALLAWLTSALLIGNWGRLALDASGILAGGLAAGGAGIAWLMGTGAWPYWIECVRTLNPEYYRFDTTEGARWLVIAGVLIRFFPWILVHLAAVPLALEDLWQTVRNRQQASSSALLAALYLGWLVQATYFQHQFDYVQLPPLLLGLALVASRWPGLPRLLLRHLLIAGLFLFLLVRFPVLTKDRAALWGRCLHEGSSPGLRDRLSLYGQVDWQDLERVANYLRVQGIRDDELTCYALRTLPLIQELDVVPAGNLVDVSLVLTGLPGFRDFIHERLAASGQKYVVVDLVQLDLSRANFAANQNDPLPIPQYTQQPLPWAEHVAYRAGRYLVLSVDGRDMPTWLRTSFNQ